MRMRGRSLPRPGDAVAPGGLRLPVRDMLRSVPVASGEVPTREDTALASAQAEGATATGAGGTGLRKPRPLILSRYILLGQLGSGGSSMVYKAYDPDLDRKVALKLLQTRSDDASGRGRTRLQREAQAMAQLTHPHVVTVHDVAPYSELDLGLDANVSVEALEIPPRGLFIVMELVEGGDLRSWLNRRHRTWRDVVAKMLQAGRGLAAAHEVGIVHRDFKPGNVLIGDGKVLVSDFGLARSAVPSSSSPLDSANSALSWDDPADQLTDRGAVLGTPPYMSPEQHRGEGADPRIDQFGFGVTLYEALFGMRPYSGSMREMREAKAKANFRPIPTSTEVPARVMAVIERALRPAAEDRYPSMNELLEALERAGRPRVSPHVLTGVAVVAVAGAVGASMLAGDDVDCEGTGAERLAAVWGSEQRDKLRDAFAASAAPYARSAAQRVEQEIDDWTSQWEEGYRDACEATHVRHEQSSKSLDLRVSCLGRRLRELDTMIGLIVEGDPRSIENAVLSVQSLGDLSQCGDIEALAARIEPPATPQARRRVDAGYGRLAEASAQVLAGRYEETVAMTREVVAEGKAVGYAPLEAAGELQMADALALMGDFRGAEEHLLASVLAAERSRDEPTAADAWTQLVWVVGVEQNRHDEALRWARFAEASLDRLGPDALRRAALDHNRAGVYYRLGRYDEALTQYQRAYDVQREGYGEQHPLVAQTVNHIGNVLIMQERYEQARLMCEQALAIRRETLGKDHPRVAAPLNNLSELVGRQGDRHTALAYAEQALAITRGTGRPEELFAWILTARHQEALDDPKAELAARRRVLVLLDEHPGFDQSIRPEHVERVTALEAALPR